MSRLEQRRKFLNILFDQDDTVAWGMGKQFVRARDPYPEFLHTNENMMCINPCTYRRFDKITNVYSLLFEVDKGMTPKQQVKAFLESKIPFTTMTYSGNKSVHVIVRFANAISYENHDDSWQKAWWQAIADALLKHGIIVDESTKAVGQISRLPGSLNEKTNKEQKLLLLKKRVTHEEMLKWLQDNDVALTPPQPKKPRITYTTELSDIKKYDIAKRKNIDQRGLYTPSWETGGYMWFFALGARFSGLNLDPYVGTGLAQIDFGTEFKGQSDGGWVGSVEDAILKGHRYAEKRN